MQFFIWIVISFIYCKVPVVDGTYAQTGFEDDPHNDILPLKSGNIPLLNRKVIKGHRVAIREHPYVVSIRRLGSHYLSGAILAKNLFITIAHPIFNVPITELGVVSGENYSDRGTMMFTVVLTVFHEHFNPFTLQNDIVLLRTYEETGFKCAMKPIKLYSPEDKLNGFKGFVTGWGRCDTTGTEICFDRTSRYYPNERQDPMLRTVTFDIVHPDPRCLDYQQYDIHIYPGMLCLGQSRRDDPTCPCLGSPGSLLVAKSELVGIQSWGYGCGYLSDLPLIYTDIRYYIPWITRNVMFLRSINQHNISGLFQATRAVILSEWIIKTRVITPAPEKHNDKSMELLEIDEVLTKLSGKVYDIRDYISNGLYHAEKVALYNNLQGNEDPESTNAPTTLSTEMTEQNHHIESPNERLETDDEA